MKGVHWTQGVQILIDLQRSRESVNDSLEVVDRCNLHSALVRSPISCNFDKYVRVCSVWTSMLIHDTPPDELLVAPCNLYPCYTLDLATAYAGRFIFVSNSAS